jgi:filamentous hemagglutinin family protein
MRFDRACLSLAIALPMGLAIGRPLWAEPVPADDSLGTIVTPNDNRFDITGGRPSSSGTNLFHGFDRFDLNAGETANFIVSPEIQNVFSRISSGNPSTINGLVQLTGGSANLYLLNPAGIVFGSSAQVNVPGSFYATSANAVRFGLDWFNAFEDDDVSALNGSPDALAFSPLFAGAILNDGSIAAAGQVGLLGGNVLSTGSIVSNSNSVVVTAIEGDRLVRIQPSGTVLSFDIGVAGLSRPEDEPIAPASTGSFEPLSLADLITGPASDIATGVSVTDDGAIVLTSTGQTIDLEPGAALVTGPVNGVVGNPLLQVTGDRDPGNGINPNQPHQFDDFSDFARDFATDFDQGADRDLGDRDLGDRDLGDRDLGDRELAEDWSDGKWDFGDQEDDGPGDGPDRDLDADTLALLGEIDSGHWGLDAGLSDLFADGAFDSGLEQLENNWQQKLEDYLGRDVQSRPTSPASLRDLLADIQRQTTSRTAIVYVMLHDRQTDLVVVTGEGNPLYRRSEVSRGQVLAAVDQLRQAITNPLLRNGTAYLAPAQDLDRWLIDPIAPDLQRLQIDTLLISPDAGLRSLPWAALHNGDRFLVQRFALGMTPSVNLTDARYVSLQNAPVLAMGASQFTGGLRPLPAVPAELAMIATERDRSSTFLNDQFTIANLQAQRLRQPEPILHLATHGEFKPGQPANSYIQFWNQERLTLDRLRELGLNNPPVELLVLSACRTAVGDLNAELGFAGLAVQAGVKSALASLWYVSDEGTLALMSEFYNRLTSAPTKALALQQAQISLIEGRTRLDNGNLTFGSRGPIPLPSLPGQSQSLAHPYYWAAFITIGSPW